MMTNDDTKLMPNGNQGINPQEEQMAQALDETPNKNRTTWKKVAIGGASGILLGAGALYAVNAMAGESDADAANQANGTTGAKAAGSTVATVNDNMSFDEAFQAARAQVGAGGVFEWHGGVYGTYTTDEWNAMSEQEKAEFTQTAMANVHPQDQQSNHTAVHQNDVEVHHEVVYEREVVRDGTPESSAHTEKKTLDNGQATATRNDEPFIKGDNDVHVVGQTTVQGHEAVALDLNSNGEADVVVIDVNDNRQLDNDDVLVFRDGSVMTGGELAQANAAQESGNATAGTETQPDYTEGYMQTSHETGEYDPNLQQASYTEDAQTVDNMGEYDPNFQQASYTDDAGMGDADPTMGVDGMDGASDNMQYI